MVWMSRVINEPASGKLETKLHTTDMGEMEIGNGVYSRNLRSVGKSEGGNRAAHLVAMQGGG